MGFGDNYNYNFGPATRTYLPHTPLLIADKTEGQQEDDDTASSSVEQIPCYQLLDEDAPWVSKDGNGDKDDDDLIQVATSSASSIFLTKRGKVFACGMMHGTILPQLTQMVIELPLKCVEIAAGRHFCLARMEGGLAVCSWGAGHFGQLALGGESPPFTQRPTVIEKLLPHMVGAPISRIAAGHWHGMAATEAGALYTWGCNRSAQCGFKPGREPPMVCSPYGVTLEGVSPAPKIIKVEAGRSHSVALDDQGRVFAFGSCTQGQCGIYTRRRGGEAPPKQVESLMRVQIVDIAAGDSHTLALSGGGRLFAFGSGHEGQLGTGSIIQMNPKPKIVGDLDFVAIEAGREWKSLQKVKRDAEAGLDQGEAGRSSNSGEDVDQDSSSSSLLQHASLSQVPKIVSIHAAGNCSMAISSHGHLYTWGCNDADSLGLPKLDYDQLPFAEPVVPTTVTSTLRQFHTRSFDSSHNISLPQRVDCLRHINVTSVSSSSTFMWCIGKLRKESENDASNSVGLTLCELQDTNTKRRKSLRTRHRPPPPKATETDVSLDNTKKQDNSISRPVDNSQPAVRLESADVNTNGESEPKKVSSVPPTTPGKSSLVPKSPLPSKSPAATKGKRRFSLPKAIGKIVRRASKGSGNDAENAVED